MSRKTRAEPIAGFGLYQPVFRASSLYRPPFVAARNIQRPVGSQSDFRSDAYRSQRIVKKIALDAGFLRLREGRRQGEQQQQKYPFHILYSLIRP